MKTRKGYIFENNGKWFARITLTDNTGKRRNIKRTAKTKSDAGKLLKQIIRQLDDEGAKIIDSWSMTFNDLIDYYQINYLQPAVFLDNQKVVGLRALDRVELSVAYFQTHFGRQRLRDINYDDVLAYRTHRLQTPIDYKTHKRQRTISTVNRELACLRRIFNIAIQQGWLIKNPFKCGDALILTSCERKRERILTLAEEQRLLAVCSGEREITYTRKGKLITAKIANDRKTLKALLIALLDTGARKGEMLKLKWSDVDFELHLITVQALNTKTLKSRQVAITERLRNELRQLWENSEKDFNSRVFGITDNVRKSFASACADAEIKHGGIDGLTLHCLRHTAATRLVKGNLPIQMVGRILGHTQPQTTYRYLSANSETLFQAANILESIQINLIVENQSELIN